jgi:hypothetical protein
VRLLKVLAALLGLLLLTAASPAEVIPGLEEDGFYIEAGSSASASTIAEAIAEAGFEGGRLYVVVLSEEPSISATFFADEVLDDLGNGTVLTVAPQTVGYASDGTSWSEDQLNAAIDDSLDGGSDTDVVVRFVESLTDTSVGGGAGGGVGGGSGDGGSSGGGSGLVWLLVIGGGFVLLFLFLRSRSNQTIATARSGRLAEFRTAAQEKLNAIANDILDMEEEVRLAENTEIADHYNSASRTYAELVDTFDDASSPQQLIEVTFKLDVAIWELDVVEAMLDGKPVPPKPEPPRLEPPPDTTKTADPVVSAPTRPPFDRRPQRQSSPTGPDLGSILMAILAAQGLGGNRSRGGWTGAPRPGGGGGFGGGGRRGGSGRIRGGGRRRG